MQLNVHNVHPNLYSYWYLFQSNPLPHYTPPSVLPDGVQEIIERNKDVRILVACGPFRTSQDTIQPLLRVLDVARARRTDVLVLVWTRQSSLSLSLTLSFICFFVCLLACLLIHSFVCSFIYSFVYSLIYLFINIVIIEMNVWNLLSFVHMYTVRSF